MKILCLSHSDRPFVGSSTSAGAITSRFIDRGPVTNDDISDCQGIDAAVPYVGALSFWLIDEQNRTASYLSDYRPSYKVQSAVIDGDQVLICGADRIEILNRDLQLEKSIEHPFLAGPHTIALDENGQIWISSAPANAALCFSRETGDLIDAVPMPPRFGAGPKLSNGTDLRKNYVPIDRQPTHLNSVIPVPGGGLLLTFWIQGALFEYTAKGRWREIISGFQGCHGGRPRADGNGYYFTDSTAGYVYLLDKKGRIEGRTEFASEWLHDAELINDRLIVASAGDKNALVLADPISGVVFDYNRCDRLGSTVMFTNVYDVDDAWFAEERQKLKDGKSNKATRTGRPPEFGVDERLPPLHNIAGWIPQFDLVDAFPYRLLSRRPLNSEYLLSCEPFTLWTGAYELSCSIDVLEGFLSIGILREANDTWLFMQAVDPKHGKVKATIEIEEAVEVRVVISAHNEKLAIGVDALLYWISLRHSY